MPYKSTNFLEHDLKKRIKFSRTILKYMLIRILHYLACTFTRWSSNSQISHCNITDIFFIFQHIEAMDGTHRITES